VTDPQELRRRTLENFDFKPPLVAAMAVLNDGAEPRLVAAWQARITLSFVGWGLSVT